MNETILISTYDTPIFTILLELGWENDILNNDRGEDRVCRIKF